MLGPPSVDLSDMYQDITSIMWLVVELKLIMSRLYSPATIYSWLRSKYLVSSSVINSFSSIFENLNH